MFRSAAYKKPVIYPGTGSDNPKRTQSRKTFCSVLNFLFFMDRIIHAMKATDFLKITMRANP
jgi:hypothetical protein